MSILLLHPMSDQLDNLIGGRYLVVRSLRKTHLCETFIAEDTQLPGNPLCVVKQLKPQSNEEFVLKTARKLFDNEANVLYKLGCHAQIPRLLAHLQVGEQFYLVQEFIEGKDLSQEEIGVESGRLWTEEKARSFLLDVLNTLAFVHNNNIIHRDIKPSNLIRREDGKIVVIDFGAVKEIATRQTDSSGMTRTRIIQSMGYSPPEQLNGHPQTNSDIYALGMMMMQGVTGFSMSAICNPETPPTIDNQCNYIWQADAPRISPKLKAIIAKMIKFLFGDRYQTVEDVLTALEEYSQPPAVIVDAESLQEDRVPDIADSQSAH
jgi:eukaryotic-like serine/threonine-protein kinase